MIDVLDFRCDKWTDNTGNICEECRGSSLWLVVFGTGEEWEQRICPDCLRAALAKIEART